MAPLSASLTFAAWSSKLKATWLCEASYEHHSSIPQPPTPLLWVDSWIRVTWVACLARVLGVASLPKAHQGAVEAVRATPRTVPP